MAIYTGGMRQHAEATAEANRLAQKKKKALKKEKKRKGWSTVLGRLGGTVLGKGLGVLGSMALTGITGGALNPLTAKLLTTGMMGVGSSLGTKWVDEGTKKGRLGKGLKGADLSKIKSESEYGYGFAQAASLKKGLQESRKTEWSPETMLGDIGSAYAMEFGADAIGDILGKSKLGQNVSDKLAQKYGIGGEEFAAKVTEKGTEDNPFLDIDDDFLFGAGEEAGFAANPYEFGSENKPYEFGSENFQQGGQVPNQQELLGLLISQEMQNQKAYDDTPLEEAQLTISDYFSSQNKTLGGNSTKSLSQLMGR